MLKTLPQMFTRLMLCTGVAMAAAPVALPAQSGQTITLQEAIALALQHSRELRLAKLEVTENKAKKDIARSAYFPQIKNESGILHVTDLAGVQIPAGAFGSASGTGLIPSESLFIGQGGSTSYTSGTGLAQPVTQLLRVHESDRAASADLAIANVKLSDADNQIAFRVRQLFYAVLTARATSDASRAQISASETRNTETMQGVTDGKALEVSAMETHAALLDARHALLVQEIKIRDLIMSLNDLIGLPVESTLNLIESPDYPVDIPSREEAVQHVQTVNPQIRIAAQALEKARAGLRAARDNYIPDVTGIARYSYQSGIPFLVHNFGTFGFSLTYDVFDGGKRRAEIEEAKAKLNQAEVNLENTKESAVIQIANAYNKLDELRSLVQVAQEAYDTRKEITRVTGAQFSQDAALSSAKDDALAKMNQSKASLYEATLGLSLAQANVLRILGGAAR